MTRQSKKQKELSILRTVYKKKRYPHFTASEKPDFILHHQKDFGVEITEYYPDETGARLHNMPNYAETVTNKTYIHKDDLNKLDVVTVEYFDKQSQRWKKIEQPAVIQENEPIQSRIQHVVDHIRSKSDLYSSYKKDLHDIDLIIFDGRASFHDGINEDYMRKVWKEAYERNVFESSNFRYIYLSIPGFKPKAPEVIRLK